MFQNYVGGFRRPTECFDLKLVCVLGAFNEEHRRDFRLFASEMSHV